MKITAESAVVAVATRMSRRLGGGGVVPSPLTGSARVRVSSLVSFPRRPPLRSETTLVGCPTMLLFIRLFGFFIVDAAPPPPTNAPWRADSAADVILPMYYAVNAWPPWRV